MPSKLSDNDRQTIGAMLSSNDADARLQGLLLLETSGATGSDFQVIFTESVQAAALADADKLQLEGEELVGTGSLTGDEALVQKGEQQLAKSLRWRTAFAALTRYNFLEGRKRNRISYDSLIDLVKIPAGVFTMGSPSDEPGRNDDESAVTVRITRPFWLSRTVITQQQWFTVMGTEPWTLEGAAVVDEGRGLVGVAFDPFDGRLQCGDSFPTVFVTWPHANLFCQMLTELEEQAGHLSDGQAYRLPTEAEWEFACRAGTSSAYSFGDAPDDLGDYGWFNENSDETVQEVAQLHPNPWGLFDMHGNVSEWCSDWYAPERLGGDDRGGPPTGTQRVVRGGSVESGSMECRSAARLAWEPWSRDWHLLNIGFRVVLSAKDGDETPDCSV